MSFVATHPIRSLNTSPVQAGAIAGLAAAMIWGGYLSLSRAGVSAGLDGYDVAFLRYVVAGPLMLLAWMVFNPRGRPNMRLGQALAVAALLGPPFVFLSVGGYAYAPLAHGAVILPATLTLGGFLLTRIFLRQKLTKGQATGAIAIVLGLVFIAGPSAFQSGVGALRGDAMFVLAGLLWAGFSVLQQRWKLNAIDVTTVVSLAGLVTVVPVYLWLRGVDAFADLSGPMLSAQIIIQGVLSGVVAMIAFAKAVLYLGAARAATFPALVPGFALLIGVPLTMEIPGPLQVVGIVIVGLGLVSAINKT
ncbi:DMT family transporter [uncultured Tateyamaria sp.]|uniref:DMT family transporter n=1 Tax=uncultured Tateyamaria sp. TaxID=455651 RepID=UPI0026263C3B|nr:DMT family transporter [uncultured Tateyamaria sp.]